jgi:hypothetical protein
MNSDSLKWGSQLLRIPQLDCKCDGTGVRRIRATLEVEHQGRGHRRQRTIPYPGQVLTRPAAESTVLTDSQVLTRPGQLLNIRHASIGQRTMNGPESFLLVG